MKHPNALTQVFCKTPVLGDVKTRLEPALGRERALSLYEEMLQMTIPQATCHALSACELWVTEAGDQSFFDGFGLPVHLQHGDDLGERMRSALQAGLASYTSVVLVGGDVPGIDAAYLDRALHCLQDHDVVLGPAEDGGYGLVGVRGGVHGQVPEIFSSMTWSSDQVLAETCCRLNDLQMNYALLPRIWDVDVPEDLPRYYAWVDSLAT